MTNEWDRTNFMVGSGFSRCIGPYFPYLGRFQGGKGVATLFGMILAIQPLVAVLCVGIFLLVLYLTRFVSLSSILASIAFAVFILVIFNEKEPLYRGFAIAVALLVVLDTSKEHHPFIAWQRKQGAHFEVSRLAVKNDVEIGT